MVTPADVVAAAGTHLHDGGVVCLRLPARSAGGHECVAHTHLEITSDGKRQLAVITMDVVGLDPDLVRAALVEMAAAHLGKAVEVCQANGVPCRVRLVAVAH